MNQLQKNRLTILLIFALAVVPFLAAWMLSNNPQLVKTGTSNGQLITPPITTQLEDFIGSDAFSKDNIKELQGHWVLMTVINQAQCLQSCQDMLYKTHQLSLMMGKDVVRLRRLALLLQPIAVSNSANDWLADPRLLKASAQAGLLEKLQKLLQTQLEDGWLYLIDPLGNIMMRYAPGYDPYQVKADLGKLLRISQIG